ncbi:MAG: riboflavin biosynthesis protein RibF [Clostridiales bacterium]|nr:riboflavin biosynthesis protein RibF [Clostridiales bacterium]
MKLYDLRIPCDIDFDRAAVSNITGFAGLYERDFKSAEPGELAALPKAVALGGFDGVHLGHRALLRSCVKYAAENLLLPSVWTFDEAPGAIFASHGGKAVCLSDAPSRRVMFAEAGIAAAAFEAFSDIRNISPEAFVKDILIGTLNTKAAFCGFNFTFGAGGKGKADDLVRLMKLHGGTAVVVPPLELDGAPVSSTRIRELLSAGDAGAAARLLGEPWRLTSDVSRGRQFGRRLGIPTINQHFPPDMLIPRFGVYETRCEIAGGSCYSAVTNVGMRPTVSYLPGGEPAAIAESYLIGFQGDLYGKTVSTSFLRFIRPEIKFSSPEQLAEAMKNDIAKVKPEP